MTESASVELQFVWKNFYEARERFEIMSQEGFVRGMFKTYAESMLEGGTSYAGRITHQWTGVLAGSHVWEYDSGKMQGNIHINQRIAHAFTVTSEGTLQAGSVVRWPFMYGVYEHERGYPHNFYERTMNEYVRPRAVPELTTMTREVDRLWR